MDRQPTLHDERVALRPLTEADRGEVTAIAADKRVWEQHPIHDRWKPEVFTPFFDEALEQGGALAAIDRASGAIAGSSQYRPTPFDPEAIEIGWTFISPAYWGTGFNPRMKRLMLAHALQSVPRVLLRIGETNIRSRKAAEAIGATLTDVVEDGEYQGQPARHVVYQVTCEGFASGPLAQL